MKRSIKRLRWKRGTSECMVPGERREVVFASGTIERDDVLEKTSRILLEHPAAAEVAARVVREMNWTSRLHGLTSDELASMILRSR